MLKWVKSFALNKKVEVEQHKNNVLKFYWPDFIYKWIEYNIFILEFNS
jgi:hypothetical protein